MKKINGYNNYQITEDGNVFSFAQTKPRKLKPQNASQSKKGYLQVRLYNENSPLYRGRKLGKLFYVHRLVWETFKGEIPENLQVDHIDGNTHNNHIDNLQLITHKENVYKYINEEFDNMREHRLELIKDFLETKSYTKTAEKWNSKKAIVRRAIKNIVHFKRKADDGSFYYGEQRGKSYYDENLKELYDLDFRQEESFTRLEQILEGIDGTNN